MLLRSGSGSSRRHAAVPAVVALALAVLATTAGCPDDPDGADAGDAAADGARDTSSDAADGLDPDAVDGVPEIPGLSGPVLARFDQWGVLHIECQKFEDCIAAQGYFHANDRFFAMDLVRRQTRGRLSTLIGLNFGEDRDKRFRHLMSTRKGEPLPQAYWEEMNDESKAMLRAYTRGINAWLEDMRNGENGVALTREYDHGLLSDDIPDWNPRDSIALYLQLAYQLSLTSRGDIFRGSMVDALGADVAKDLFTVKPGPVSNIMQAAGVPTASSLPPGGPDGLEALRTIQRRLEPASRALQSARKELDAADSLLFGEPSRHDGSNNWVVGSKSSKDGGALLANDPHLTLNNPAIWYFNGLHVTGGSEELHVAGASIPSTPGVVVGHNESLAWGVTTARLDLADAYVETLTDDGNAVMRNGNRVDLIEKTVTIEGKDGDTRDVTLEWVKDHGPLVSKDEANNRGVSVKWVAQNAGADFNFFRPLMEANTVEEAVSALEPVETICQNWVFADDTGSIGWYPKGAIPKRPWASPTTPNWLPLPGDGSAEWQGHVADEDEPEVVDPPNGYIATANNDFDGSYTDGDPTNDGHTPWQSPPAPGNRHKRIDQLLVRDDGSHTVETMDGIQSDTHSLHGETLVPHIRAAADQASSLSSGAQDIVDVLDDWNYTCPTGLDGTDPSDADPASSSEEKTEAIGCAAFHVVLPHLTEAVFEDELEPAGGFSAEESWDRLQVALRYVFDDPSQLTRGEQYFDDTTTDGTTEKKPEIVASALDSTAQQLQNLFGSSNTSDWLWGRIHNITFSSLFSPQITQWDEGKYANDGGLSTVDVANPTGENFSQFHGPSLRIVVELGEDGVDARFQLPGGQDHHRDSPHYLSLVDEWLNNEFTDLLFEPFEINAVNEELWLIESAD